MRKIKRDRSHPSGNVPAKFRQIVDPLSGMNRTETKHATTLEAGRLAGAISGWRFEPFKLRLTDGWKTTYRPDFMVLHNDGIIELQEIKSGAGWTDDSRVKTKIAADLYPEFVFVGITYGKGDPKREVFSK